MGGLLFVVTTQTLRLSCCNSIRKQIKTNTQLWLASHTPGWRRWFLRGSIDGMFFHHAHPLLHRAFELWIVAGDNVLRPVLDIHVGRDAFILHGPTIVARQENAARRD